MSGAKLPAVDEIGLPRTKRHLPQSSNMDVTQFNTPRSDFVPLGSRLDGGRSHFLNIQPVSRAELEGERARTSIKFSNCLAISFTNFARLIVCGFPW